MNINPFRGKSNRKRESFPPSSNSAIVSIHISTTMEEEEEETHVGRGLPVDANEAAS